MGHLVVAEALWAPAIVNLKGPNDGALPSTSSQLCSRGREMGRWSAFQNFLNDLQTFLQALLGRDRCQADAHRVGNVGPIDGKRRCRRDADPALPALLSEVL